MADKTYSLRIRRCDGGGESCWQSFTLRGSESDSVAALLNRLNSQVPLTDADGNETEPVGWECSCMLRKCGACAMRINGRPRLACSTFPGEWSGETEQTVVLEPLSKFPVIRDLIVRSNAAAVWRRKKKR